MQANLEKFDPTLLKNPQKYSGLSAYERITGKACFKDYGVLMEAYEIRVMMQVFIKCQIQVLVDRNQPGFAVTDTEDEKLRSYADYIDDKV